MNDENIKTYSLAEIRRKLANQEDRTEWVRLQEITDAEIEASTEGDPDWDAFRDMDWSKAVWFVPVAKAAISIRLDEDIIAYFKKDGRGYQSRINSVLRHFMISQEEKK